MKSPRRRAGWALLLALFLLPASLTAQESQPINLAGSAVALPLVEAMIAASGADLNLNASATGTTTGFEQFCASQADVVAASRPLSSAENSACAEAGVEYLELLLAHNILAFVANPQDVYVQCLTDDELNAIFAPSAQSTVLNWNQVNPVHPDVALTPLLPSANSIASALLDEVIGGAGLRSDAAVLNSDEAVITAVGQTPGAVGAVLLPAAKAAAAQVNTLQLNLVEAAGCVAPSAETVESRLYSAANQLFLYVNKKTLSQPGVSEALNFIASSEAADIVESRGFSAITAEATALNREVLQGDESGRLFSRSTSDFTIPADVSGQVSIAGTADFRGYVTALTNRFTQAYPGVSFDTRLTGTPAGIRRLCNGEVDLVVSNRDLTDEQRQNCEATNTPVMTFELGQRAVVLVANQSSAYLTCLTPQQIAAVWKAEVGEPVTQWNQVDSSFPDTPVTLFAPPNGSLEADLLLRAAQTGAINRVDVQINGDPLYRAAATANVEGGLTFMSWQDYQRILANNQANIQLVSVNAGAGCVAPDLMTISSGEYPLAEPFKLLVNQSSLTKLQAQSFIWFLLDDANFSLFGENNLIGVEFGALPGLRQRLQQAALEAQAVAEREAPAAEATPEATEAAGG